MREAATCCHLWRLRTMTTPGHRSAMASTSDSWAPCAPGMLRTAFLTFLQVACGRHPCSSAPPPFRGSKTRKFHLYMWHMRQGTQVPVYSLLSNCGRTRGHIYLDVS